jgi:hypothetical protein
MILYSMRNACMRRNIMPITKASIVYNKLRYLLLYSLLFIKKMDESFMHGHMIN